MNHVVIKTKLLILNYKVISILKPDVYCDYIPH